MKSERIHERRKALGLTLLDIARSVGVSKQSVFKWEKGDVSPKGANLYALAKVLKCDADWILTGKGTPEAAAPTSNVAKLQPVSEFSEWSELPVYDVHAAAGAGTLVHSEFQLETLMIPTSLISEFGLMATDASIIYVDGDSMEPTLSDKDRLLVDVREQQHPVSNGVYVIRIDDAIYVKRLKWSIANGVYKVISDNPEHESFEIDHNNGRNFKIIGKAVAPVFKKIF